MTRAKITEIIDGMQEGFNSSYEEYVKSHKIDFTSMRFDLAHEKVGVAFEDCKSIFKGVSLDDYTTPKFIASYKSFEKDGKLDRIEVTVKTGLKATTKFSHKVVVAADDVLDGIYGTFNSAVMHIIKINLAEENLAMLNARLDSVLEDCDTKFRFVLDDNYISDIDDKCVVFGADLESALNISSLYLVHNTDEDDEFFTSLAEKEANTIHDAVKGSTTPQIIKSGLDIIKTVTGVSSRYRADRLLRQTYHNRAKFFNDKPKSAVGYVRKVVEIDGKEYDIFALLKKSEDGTVSVKLSPFNIKTNFNVDYDVCNNYKD